MSLQQSINHTLKTMKPVRTTKQSKEMLHLLSQYLLNRLMDVSALLIESDGKVTVADRTIKSALLVLEGTVDDKWGPKNNDSAGTKSVNVFESNNELGLRDRKSRSERSGLHFSVARVDAILRKRFPGKRYRQGTTTASYAAGVLENTTRYLVNKAYGIALTHKRKTVSKQDIVNAVNQDALLRQFFWCALQ